jgi:hypothetical protein
VEPFTGLSAGLPTLGLPAIDAPAARLDLDPQRAARDLACLVLTIVELLRQLMERQAIRRIDQGGLEPDREERLGTALMLLDEHMTKLCEAHGLRRDELGLDLGPLGTLLADDW